MALFFQRSDNCLQFAFLPAHWMKKEAVLVEPTITEADEGTPLASHYDFRSHILRLFYCRRDETGSRILHEKILRTTIKKSTWEEGSLHELDIRLSAESDIIIDLSTGDDEDQLLYVVTPYFSLQVIQFVDGGWKAFASAPFGTSINVLRAHAGPKLTMLASRDGCLEEYFSDSWQEQGFFLENSKEDFGDYKFEWSPKWRFISEKYRPGSVSKDNHLYLFNPKFKDKRPTVPLHGTTQEIGKVLHKSAYHYDLNCETDLWLDGEGQLRRISKDHLDFFSDYHYLGLKGGVVFSEPLLVITLEKAIESKDYFYRPYPS